MGSDLLSGCSPGFAIAPQTGFHYGVYVAQTTAKGGRKIEAAHQQPVYTSLQKNIQLFNLPCSRMKTIKGENSLRLDQCNDFPVGQNPETTSDIIDKRTGIFKG